MWILPTRKRPDRLQKFFDSCKRTFVSTPGLVIVDGLDGGDYSTVSLPDGWHLFVTGQRTDVCGIVRQAFRDNLKEPFYGVLADDIVAETLGWDKALAFAAGDWNVAYPNDLLNGERMATMPVIGGKLARTLGNIVPLGFVHTMFDKAWMDVGRGIGRLKYLPDVKIRHEHWSDGKTPKDDTYNRRYGSVDTRIIDGQRYKDWAEKEKDRDIAFILSRIPKGVPA